MLYADIVLPLAQPLYTFALGEDMSLEEGQAVAVPFGKNRIYTGIVWRIHDRRPPFKNVKTVAKLLYGSPLLTATQRALWEWIADYYLCSLGEVMRAALPSLLKPAGGSREEFTADQYRPRTERYISLAPELSDLDCLHEVFEKLARRAARQYDALLEIASAGEGMRTETGELPRRLLRADGAVLAALEKKGLIRSAERERDVERSMEEAFQLPLLSVAQQRACDTLATAFEGHGTVLLRGVTGSGKTEIYIHRIAGVLARGGDVLLLVPEIALTAQLIARMERIFGSRVTPYHSKLTDRQRTETYLRLNRSEGGEFVVGARSALFLPLKHLQLVIVDEEHDASYKQSDPAPRYNARDCAAVLARLAGARVLLGSATPSLESWMNAETGKYGKVVLAERYGGAEPPHIVVSDTLRAVKRGERKAHFNKLLLDGMEQTLARGGQIMLFQNRRGFSPFVACDGCGWTARCPQCNVSLTWHKADGKLVCHYCGHSESLPVRCPACGKGAVLPAGFGTEKVEEEIERIFPGARVARLDRDSVTSQKAYGAIIASFERRETDILVGTQMITKGFDFEGVSLVGILNADNLLFNPDFRASERAFQLMTQVAGRAGRRSVTGGVVIQTSEPQHPVIRQVVEGDYEGMARMQLAEREAFCYPPYARLVSFTLRHRDPERVRLAATEFAGLLRERFGRRVLGPMAPPVDRIRGEYLAGVLLKIESGASMVRARTLLRRAMEGLSAREAFKNVTLVVNVDPQ